MRREVLTHTRAEHGGPHSVRGGIARSVMDFSSSVGPLGPPGPVITAIERGVDASLSYPDPDYAALRSLIAGAREVDDAQVVLGCGASELIHDWTRALVTPHMGVLMQSPTFSEYASAARLCGARVEEFATMELGEDIGGLVSKIPHGGCVYVCNPNNPTGELLERREILEIVGAASKVGAQVLVDEAFIEFPSRKASVIGDVADCDNLYVVHSYTKTFGVPGVRVGYGIGNAHMASALREARIPWTVSGIAQEVARAATPLLVSRSKAAHITKLRAICQKESRYLRREIDMIDGFECTRHHAANFFLVRVSGRTSREVRDRLLEKGMLVRDCASFGGLGDDHIRISVSTHQENMHFMRAIESI